MDGQAIGYGPTSALRPAIPEGNRLKEREITVTEGLQRELEAIKAAYAELTQRLVIVADRALGPIPQAQGTTANGGPRPAAIGQFQVIAETTSELRQLSEYLRETVQRIERIA